VKLEHHPTLVDDQLEEIRAQTGWPVQAAPNLLETPGPTREELDAIMRFDPDWMWTG
jgi:hypothetical protein